MSDLATVVNFSKALMKIDIEGYEETALHCSEKLFNKVFISVIMMEWAAMKKEPPKRIKPMLNWFQSKRYKAFMVIGSQLKPLDFSQWQTWSFDTVLKIEV